ncbi:MAG: DUF433 domain-containing protein [Deltaproteobacteria bacterium]|nr:DUF433 domain-containing protein [Deltaproteobacteria bacterium]
MAQDSGKDFSAVTKDLLEEAIKMRRCPGIVFAEGMSGRTARVAGSGIEVWEIIATYQSLKKDTGRLKKSYHWLSAEQLRAALAFYSAYPEEIDRQIEKNQRWSQEEIRKRYPFMSPPA